MTTSLKSRITPEAVAAYQRAIAIRNAPLPVNPIARQAQQHAYFQECEALRVALDRSRCRVEILDTIGSDEVPTFIRRQGPQYADDYEGAVEIRKELERLCRGDG